METNRAPRRVLVVNYHYPPMPSVGGNRWSSMVRHLGALGWEATVIATGAFGRLPGAEERHVVRVGDFGERPLLRKLLRRPPASVGGAAPVTPHKPPPALLTRVLVPDPYAVSWIPNVIRTARRMQREAGFDCVVTSSPMESVHLAGLALRSRSAWVADLRDPWTFESLREAFPTAPQRRLDLALEAGCLRRADAVVVAHGVTAADLRARLAIEAPHIPNGWDPLLGALATSPAGLPPKRPGVTRFVHTGRFFAEPGRDPRALVDGMTRLLEDPGMQERFELVLAGGTDDRERGVWDPLRQAGVLCELGTVSRAEALGLQRSADVLLALAGRRAAALPYKLLEYLAAGRPVLALAEGTEAGELVLRAGVGAVAAVEDAGAIAGMLRIAIERGLRYEPDPEVLARYRYPEVAEEMAAVLDAAVARRTR